MKRWAYAFCGIIAVILYVATVIIGGAITPGYSHIANAISELIQAGAPAKALLDPLFVIYNLLLMIFAVGLLRNASQNGQKAARFAAVFIWMAGILGILMARPFPMDPRNAQTTFAGRMHLIAAGICSLSTMLALLSAGLSFSKSPMGKGYALYSYITLVVVLVTGALAAVSAGGGLAFMGLAERATIGAFLQWVFFISLTSVYSMSRDPQPPLHRYPTA